MPLTDTYRKQHGELLELAGKISSKLSKEDVVAHSGEIISILSQFASKLNMHLTMEDKALYPKLMASSNSQTSATAQNL